MLPTFHDQSNVCPRYAAVVIDGLLGIRLFGLVRGIFIFNDLCKSQHPQVLSTDELQTFVLPANAPVGRFLRVCLHGKRQRQLEDLNFYAAMR